MCQLKRNCPLCGVEKKYKTKYSYDAACKKNTKCRKCAADESGFLERYTKKNSGVNNPFFGKKHTEEAKLAMKLVDKSRYKTDEFREKMKCVVSRGKDHHMFGSSHNLHWITLYGEQQAIELELKRRKKISDKTSGKNNPMYGKPSPQGSGYGWKGWYKNWFFRSLRELSYVINVIEKNNWTWVSAEKKEFAIQYIDWENKTRNYFADFIINGNKLVEIKPAKLHNSPNILFKIEAAKKFCKMKGWIFEIVDPVKLTDNEITILHDEGRIKFMDKYERKYIERK